MNELATYQIIACIIVLITLPAFLFKWIAKDTKYEREATIFIFSLDVLFTCAIYYGIIYRNTSLSSLFITAVSIAFFAILYYKTRKFYLHRYN